MTSWNDFATEQPELAATAVDRFAAHLHHVLATLRADGSPRVSGIEVFFRAGELWVGMMPSSRKALDLLRDPRLALHVNPGEGPGMGGGDVRVAGRGLLVTDETTIRSFVEAVKPPEPFHLFRVDVTEVTRVHVEGDDLVTELWRPGAGVRVMRRAADDSPVRED